MAYTRNIQITDVIELDDYIPSKVDEIDQITRDTYQRTRGNIRSKFISNTLCKRRICSSMKWPVYLYIGEHVALVDFVNSLDRLKVLDDGSYVIISIDDFSYDPETNASSYTSRSK